MEIPKRTHAVVFAEKDRAEVREVDLPEMKPDDVLVKVEYSSISTGTERWCLTAQLHEPGVPPVPFPFVPGYQAAGVIAAAGRDVKGLKVGDRVFSVCGRLAGKSEGSCWGGHIQHHVTECSTVVKLPDNVSTREAAGLVLAQVGYNGATQPPVKPGDVVAVIGDGLVGQYAGQVFRDRGAHVVLSGHHDARLKLAARYAADEVVNSRREDFAAYVKQRWPDGVQIAAESASRNELVRLAISLTEYNGKLVLLGYYPQGECLIDIHWVRARETTIFCPNSLTRPRLERTLELIAAGRMHVEELITHEFPVAQAPDAYRLILEKGSDFLGIVLRWTD